MEYDKTRQEKKQKAIGVTLGLIVVLIASIGAAFAYWVITREQEGTNSIHAKCLNIEMGESNGAISLSNQWPLKDSDGKKLTGYTFTVTNNCDSAVDYMIGLETFDEPNINEIDSSSIKVMIDVNRPINYDDLDTIGNVDVSGKTPIINKELGTTTLEANETNTHTLRIWIDQDSTEISSNSTISSKINISAGQGIVNDHPLRTILASADVSYDSGNDDVTATFYSDGELSFSGTGKISSDAYSLISYDLFVVRNKAGFTEQELNDFLSGGDLSMTLSYAFAYGLMSDEAKIYNTSIKETLDDYLELYPSYETKANLVIQKIENTYPSVTDLNIEDGITEIASNAFGLLSVGEYNVAGTVDTLSESPMFYEEINLFEGITMIGEAFNESSQTELVLPKSIMQIHEYALNYVSYESIKFNKYSKINQLNFRLSSAVKKLYIPESVTDMTNLNWSGTDHTYYFYGPERTITGFNPSGKTVIWNYSD